MTPLRLLLLLFVAVPLLEIYLLIKVGSLVGALPTVALVVLTALLGAVMVRLQGLATVARLQQALERAEVPATAVFDGACLLVAGALLLTPGFFTDALGFLCLVPRARRALLARVVAHLARQRPPPSDPGGPRTLEGEYRRED